MKKVVCELCGSNELRKEDGDYVCQHCGTRYSTDEARKLLVDANVSGEIRVGGTIDIDGLPTVKGLVARGKKEEERGNLARAREFYERAETSSPDSKVVQTGLKSVSRKMEKSKGRDLMISAILGFATFAIMELFLFSLAFMAEFSLGGEPTDILAGMVAELDTRFGMVMAGYKLFSGAICGIGVSVAIYLRRRHINLRW